jgi:hypothetical protein
MTKNLSFTLFASVVLMASSGYCITGQEMKSLMDDKEVRMAYSWQVRTMTEAVINSRGPAKAYAFVFNKSPELTLKFMLGGGAAVVEGLGKETLLSLTRDMTEHPETVAMAVANAMMDQGLIEYRENCRLYKKWKTSGVLTDEEYEQMAKNVEGINKLALGKDLFTDVMSYKYDKTAQKAMQIALVSQADKVLETGETLGSLVLAAKVAEIVDMAQKGLDAYPPWQRHLKRVRDSELKYPKMAYEKPKETESVKTDSLILSTENDEARGTKEVLDVSKAINVAASANGAMATADSTGRYMDYIGSPMKAIDGDTVRGWCGTGIPGWLQIEFKECCLVNKVSVHFGSHKQTFSIAVSADGRNWVTVIPARSSLNSEGKDSDPETFDINPIKAKSIRVDISRTSAPGSHIFQTIINEVAVFGVLDSSDSVAKKQTGRENVVGSRDGQLTEIEPPVVQAGLIAYYPFDGDAFDASGNGNDATLHNTASYVPGKYSKAIHLQGRGHAGTDGDHVTFPGLSLNNRDAFTVALWVKHDGYAGSWDHGESYIAFGRQYATAVNISFGGTPWSFGYSGSNKGVPTPSVGTEWKNWVHHALVFSNGSLSAYKDGVLVGTKDGVTVGNVTQGGLGITWFNSGGTVSTRFIGSMDDVRIYNRALSDSEICQLAGGTSRKAFKRGTRVTAQLVGRNRVDGIGDEQVTEKVPAVQLVGNTMWNKHVFFSWQNIKHVHYPDKMNAVIDTWKNDDNKDGDPRNDANRILHNGKNDAAFGILFGGMGMEAPESGFKVRARVDADGNGILEFSRQTKDGRVVALYTLAPDGVYLQGKLTFMIARDGEVSWGISMINSVWVDNDPGEMVVYDKCAVGQRRLSARGRALKREPVEGEDYIACRDVTYGRTSLISTSRNWVTFIEIENTPVPVKLSSHVLTASPFGGWGFNRCAQITINAKGGQEYVLKARFGAAQNGL